MAPELNIEDLARKTYEDGMNHYKPTIFRPAAMERFLKEILVEIDPQFSVAKSTMHQYSNIFQKFMIEKYSFELWNTRNDN